MPPSFYFPLPYLPLSPPLHLDYIVVGVIRLCVHLGKDGVVDGFVLKVVRVVGLDLIGEALEGSLESLLGGGVDHLGLFVHVSKKRSIVEN